MWVRVPPLVLKGNKMKAIEHLKNFHKTFTRMRDDPGSPNPMAEYKLDSWGNSGASGGDLILAIPIVGLIVLIAWSIACYIHS